MSTRTGNDTKMSSSADGNPNRRPKVGIGVIVTGSQHPGCILLGRRKGDSAGTGQYSLPGGHLEFGESWADCACRETEEETGLRLKNVQYQTTLNVVNKSADYHYVEMVMQGEVDSNYSTEPVNMEPDKCEGWFWVNWKDLASQGPLFYGLQVLLDTGFNPFGCHQD